MKYLNIGVRSQWSGVRGEASEVRLATYIQHSIFNIQYYFSLRLCVSAFILLMSTHLLHSQIGGNNVYEFLNLPSSARITALGGSLIAVRDSDISLAYNNPAALNKEMHNVITFNQNFHVADIRNSYAAYGRHIEKWNSTFHVGFQTINYGNFQSADEFGNIIGTFQPSELAITIGAGRELYERMSVGVNVKLVSSTFEAYNSFGISSDLAAMYYVEDKDFTATLLFKNAGSQISTFRDGNREDLPFEIQLGISKKLKYLPFRFSITAQHLQQWNLLYDNPNSEENTFFLGEPVATNDNEWIDNIFRHFIFSGEFLFGKAEVVNLRFAYNHFLKRELSINNLRSLAGFSAGLGIKIRRFRFSYGVGVYHIGGSTHHLSLATNLSEFSRRTKR